MKRQILTNSLQEGFHLKLEEAPENPAISFYGRDFIFSWVSREQFLRQAAGYAYQLAEYGLQKGDVCILVLNNGEFSTYMTVAILLMGGIPLLVAPPTLHEQGSYSTLSEIIHFVIKKAKPPLVVCTESMIRMRRELKSNCPKTQIVFGETEFSHGVCERIPAVMPSEKHVAAMQLTSGTTGFPRICVWKQKSVVAALQGMAAAMNLSDNDICFNWTPLYHDMGLANNLLLCLYYGIPLTLLKPEDFVGCPGLWLRGLYETNATITWSPNFGYAIAAQRIRDEELDGVCLDGVRAFYNAAECIHNSTIQTFYKRFSDFGVSFKALKTNYGCAENIGGATFSHVKNSYVVEHLDHSVLLNKMTAQRISESEVNRKIISVVSIGRPNPGMQIKILSRTGKSLPDGKVGEIALDTPSRMEGYLFDKRATQQVFTDNLLRTGDLGYKRGEELFWVGRLRERINIRGKKIDPSYFESILLKIPGLRAGCFVAFGVDDEKIGTQQIVIASEINKNTSRNYEDIMDEIRTQVLVNLGVNVGDIILLMPNTLTKTSSGKRRHSFFRQLYQEGKLNDYQWHSEHNITGNK